MYFFRSYSCLDVSLDCCYSCCILIGVTLCIIGLPIINLIFWNAINRPDLSNYCGLAVALIIYLILACAVILGFKNVICYKINGEVYNIDSNRVNNQNQNIEVQNDVQDITIQTASPPVANIFESSETDLPPSYTECVISSPPNKVQIPDSEPPPSYYV